LKRTFLNTKNLFINKKGLGPHGSPKHDLNVILSNNKPTSINNFFDKQRFYKKILNYIFIVNYSALYFCHIALSRSVTVSVGYLGFKILTASLNNVCTSSLVNVIPIAASIKR